MVDLQSKFATASITVFLNSRRSQCQSTNLIGQSRNTPIRRHLDCTRFNNIIGNVKRARKVGIWFGSVLRGDNELHHNWARVTNIPGAQPWCILIGAGFPAKRIGQTATIDIAPSSQWLQTIDDNSQKEQWAIVLNGRPHRQKLSDWRRRAHSEGKSIPRQYHWSCGQMPRQSQSAPLTDDDLQKLTESANLNYQENAKTF